MLLATVLLSAALVPQTASEEIETPFDAEPVQEAAPSPPAPLEATPIPEPAAAPPAAAPGGEQASLDAGLRAFIRGRFSTARDAFQKAYDANPRDPAAAFYLGYALYKLGEPSRRMGPDKEKARELFAQAYSLDPTFQPVWGRKKE